MKALILAAGYGTRNLPLTKTLPKELLPLYNKTVIDFILEECQEVGIKDLIVVTNRRKKALEDYFDRDPELECLLKKNEKNTELTTIKLPCDFNVTFLRQHKMLGTGHALLSAKHLLKEETFAVFFPDDIILYKIGGLKQILNIYNETKCSILGARDEFENISAYGVIEYEEKNGFNYIRNIVEKPKNNSINSTLVSVGRFIYTPEFLEALEASYQDHITGEFFPMDAMMTLAKNNQLIAHRLKGNILDTGNHNSYLQSILEYADQTEDGRKIIDYFIHHRKR